MTLSGLEKMRFICAAATLAGTIIGVGIFGIPFVVAQAGFATGVFYLVAIAFLSLFMHLAYAEAVLRTGQDHRLIGYIGKYFGSKSKKVATAVLLVEYYGIILAYIIVGGEFLNLIFSNWLPSSQFIWSIIFFFFAAWAIFLGPRALAKNELFFTGLLILAAIYLSAKGIVSLNPSNLTGFDWAKFFVPYGVIFFSFGGSTAIPEIRQILKGREKKIKSAIILGTLIPLIIYLLFALAVVGVSGSKTSPEAIKGLVPFLGEGTIILGAVFGILAIFTSFLTAGMNLKKIFQYDYRVKSFPSFILALGLPIAAYLLGFKNFIVLIAFTGAVLGGIDGIFTILVYLRAKKLGDRRPEFSLPKGKFLAYLTIALFVFGIIYQIAMI